MNQFGWRDGRADNAQALKACDPLGRVGSNPTPSATISSIRFLMRPLVLVLMPTM